MALLKQLALVQFVPNPAAPTITNVGTAGAASSSYGIVAVDSAGNKTAVGATGSTSTGNASPNGSNFNRATWAAVAGAVSYLVYRLTGGGSQGLIGSTASTSFDDTGLAGDASTAPSTNLTGIGAKQDVTGYDDLCFQLSNGGVTPDFVATVLIEASLDLVEWFTILTLSAGSRQACTPAGTYYPAVRAHMTAYTQGIGTLKAYVGAR